MPPPPLHITKGGITRVIDVLQADDIEVHSTVATGIHLRDTSLAGLVRANQMLHGYTKGAALNFSNDSVDHRQSSSRGLLCGAPP